jgi:iron only hydrogenase large subunit-like protein
MSSFSNALRLSDLNDFLAPSQSCIKPMLDAASAPPTASGASAAAGSRKKAHIEIGVDGQYSEVSADGSTRVPLPQAKITLNDCLACSGCVTSAETVLITAQSVDQVRADLAAALAHVPPRPVVVTLASQSVASLAARHNLSMLATYRRLVHVLRSQFGVARVCDAAFARDVALLETLDEFVARRRDSQPLPLLASSCPGWVCYAEKAHGALVLPFMSRTKSPQQLMGSLVRQLLAPQLACAASDIYHLAVMPCFDKKLEASRNEFARDVDCVIATNELPALLNECDFVALPEAPLDESDLLLSNVDNSGLAASTAGGSGGYAEFILRHAPARLLGAEAAAACSVKPWVSGRNKDLQTAEVVDAHGAVVLKVAVVNGFRNIQTLVSWLKKGAKIDFVEVMACPSGCVNGGGQLRPVAENDRAPTRTDGERLLSAVHARYAEIALRPELTDENSRAFRIWQQWRATEPPATEPVDEATYRASLLRTQYFIREAVATNPLAIKW